MRCLPSVNVVAAIVLLAIAILLIADLARAGSRLGVEVDLHYLAHVESAQTDESILQVEPEWEHRSSTWSVYALGRLRATRDQYLPGQPGQATRAEHNRRADLNDHISAELREFYLDARFGRLNLRLGKQQVVWGEADGLKVLDVINPTDFTEFILEPFEDSRIPTWLVSATAGLGSVNLEIVWSLDSSAHLFSPNNGNFALSSSRTAQPAPELVDVIRRDNPIASPEGGVRLSSSIGSTDVSLVAMSRFNDFAVFQQPATNATNRPLTAEYFRETLYGVSATRALGDLVVRSELAYIEDRRFTPEDLSEATPVESDVLQGVLGLDWFAPKSWLLSLQYFVTHRRDDIAARDPRQRDEFATLSIRKRLKNDQAAFSVITLYNRLDRDWLIRPKLSYEISDTWELSAGADLFRGTRAGTFGQFQDASRLFFSLTWQAGL